MEKPFISLATCELLSIWFDAASASDEINSCIDWVTTGGTGPWAGPAQPSDEFSDWNVFSRVRSCPLRQEIFCRLEILDVILWTLIYGQLSPKSIFSRYKHGSQSSQRGWTPNKGLKVLPFVLPQLCSPWGKTLAPFSTASAALWFHRWSLLGATGNSSALELPWAVLPEPFQPFVLPDTRKGSCNCCSSPNLFSASVTLSPSSLSEVILKMGTVNWEKNNVLISTAT